jgi:hypothetical protein
MGDGVQDDDAPVAVRVGDAQGQRLGGVRQAVGGDRPATGSSNLDEPGGLRADVAPVQHVLDHEPDGNADQECHAEDLGEHQLILLPLVLGRRCAM